ncbi:MAG: hypothetical protein A2987_04020 [Omnitrophica bacterium RIFCSPLOWO2_01_FULL_45_10]|nr:MAG: hypothetical protein A2987_04020 [Omnitrophica bacterium RIFCSPLOWO2_01_FULL_45_10]
MSDILKNVGEKEKERSASERGKASSIKTLQFPLMRPQKALLAHLPPPSVKPQKEDSDKAYYSNIVKYEKGKEGKYLKPEIRISGLVRLKPETVLKIEEDGVGLYDEVESLLRELFCDDVDYETIDSDKIMQKCEKIVDALGLGDEKILRPALIKNAGDVDYLYGHLVSSCIYSIVVGIGMGYQRSELIGLGASALLHDIGMTKYLALAAQPRALTFKEREVVKNHVLFGTQILKNIDGLSDAVIAVSYQHHERVNGSGYPRGLKGEFIHEYAKIVGLVSVFEALVHLRPHRVSFLPVEALREIIVNKNTFEYKIIKILIERIGIYPIGSLVELNTRETAEVIKLNNDNPARPVVRIIRDDDGEKPKETKLLDLAAQSAVYIKNGVREKI